MLDYADLLKPYSTPTRKGDPERTPEGQRAWLLKKGFDAGTVDTVMAQTYAEVAAGRTFASGHAFDRHMHDECYRARSQNSAVLTKAQEARVNAALVAGMKQARGLRKPKGMLRHPIQAVKWHRDFCWGVFTGATIVGLAWLGSAFGETAWQLITSLL